MKNSRKISFTKNGSIYISNCGCCLKITYKKTLWSFKTSDFTTFKNYIERSISKNFDNKDLILISMKKSCMHIYLDINELKELNNLLDDAELEINREKLENLYKLTFNEFNKPSLNINDLYNLRKEKTKKIIIDKNNDLIYLNFNEIKETFNIEKFEFFLKTVQLLYDSYFDKNISRFSEPFKTNKDFRYLNTLKFYDIEELFDLLIETKQELKKNSF